MGEAVRCVRANNTWVRLLAGWLSFDIIQTHAPRPPTRRRRCCFGPSRAACLPACLPPCRAGPGAAVSASAPAYWTRSRTKRRRRRSPGETSPGDPAYDPALLLDNSNFLGLFGYTAQTEVAIAIGVPDSLASRTTLVPLLLVFTTSRAATLCLWNTTLVT